jgi:hypothetical protein
VRGEEGAGGEDRLAARVGEDRADKQAGHAAGHRFAVTLKAVVGLADEAGLGWGLLDRIKIRAERGIDAGDLDDVPAGDVADVGVVVEVKGARAGGRDGVTLEAGLGEDEGLRRGGDLEFAQQRVEIAALAAVVLESELPALDRLHQLAGRVARRGGAVGDGRLLVVGRGGGRLGYAKR